MRKRGNSLVSMPIILVICVVILIVIGVNFIGIIKPFIMYEKLNKISEKYMFIIEKFGYLTNNEKNSLINELKNKGFDISKISINAPLSVKTYGELLNFDIIYDMYYNTLNFENGKIKLKNNVIKLKVTKNSYSKI